jgi:hypothetical protein
MPCQGIVPRKGLLFGAQVTSNFLLAGIVDSVFVTSEIIWTREDRIAGLAGRWINPFALVWSSLRVAETEVGRSGGRRCGTGDRRSMSMCFTLVLLQLGGSLESKGTPMVGAGVSSRVR